MISFRLSEQPLDGAALRAELADPSCGGFVCFEGWVRDHHGGRGVTRLEYESYATLALAEGARVLEEARLRFGLSQALCVHRVGDLALGEVAVWVGVATPHRDAAFRACRHIIDAIKHRLPVWKKEHYDDGDSGWVNCEHAAAPAAVAPDYSRQMQLPEIGAAGQARLTAARVLVVGAGGLGVPVLQYLAASGVGQLGIVDGDVLEASNLHRQPLYSLADCGQPKAALAAARLSALNPSIRVRPHAIRLTTENVADLLPEHDVVVDCTDNYATKFLLNDWARKLRKTVVTASVYQYEGQLQVVRPEGVCLRCVWPHARDGLVGNCAASGVLGPVPALLGTLQAMEVLKLLLDLPGGLRDEVMTFDLLTLETRRLKAQRAADCAQRHLPADAAPIELRFDSLHAASAAGYTLIDVREDRERAQEPAPGSLHVPLARLLSGEPLPPATAYLLVCAQGVRSQSAASWLREHGVASSWSLHGGLDSFARHTEPA
jgi:molybdopterin/thiamine biosynthesis adenylyltransferase/molybdopterin synthase catalytic subunit/rhodanese-related sulfurtransferase